MDHDLCDRASFGPPRDRAIRKNLGVVTGFSLAFGFLTGRYRTEADPGDHARSGMVARRNGLRMKAERNMPPIERFRRVPSS